ncbi:MBL fold metallo-hydrolase [Phytohabitans houttuyneae]|uniref:MBL fold metallo-hydrolase n=1 Tax=Phytohabitans houttuyneae TaxID=1076126 RepID=A0A6V8JZF8_9ACTN|nr:MBL fold metallo-hydrolase [Phytohabitans houttuyneae]GFJ78203.1 MBL fold metallo-hydrolase [Phytohabitans houttuyneae]
MRLTKYTHACVRLDDGDRRLVIDPGIWSEGAALEGVSHVLITHEHFDHVDVDKLAAAQLANAGLKVYAHADVAAQLEKLGDAVVTVASGDEFDAGGFAVRVVGGAHAEIYDGLPGCANVGFVVEGVYHPGDSLFVPDVPVTTLLVPTSAPWLKLAEGIEFVRAVGPARAHSIHDAMLSDKGEQIIDRWHDLKGGTEYSRIPVGGTVDL